jgi:hypothetical protein
MPITHEKQSPARSAVESQVDGDDRTLDVGSADR